ncbi:MAG: hypothetical protein Pg6B_01660 [Candidatus Azobacteroides pseudotrichonymphae]|jgi:hypothetical protein|nr:MAG: hypothetical protein Pg6B_01660 [Candidatus Azobacteroides pseudotrichonymphae]
MGGTYIGSMIFGLVCHKRKTIKKLFKILLYSDNNRKFLPEFDILYVS